MSITVFGAIFVDIKGYPYNVFIPKGRNVGQITTTYGGVSRNVSEDLGNIELKPTFVSMVDDTPTGKDIIARLNKHGVNTSYIHSRKDCTGTWLAVFNERGDVEAAISRRPDLTGILETLETQGDEIFKNADSIALEIDIEEQILNKILELSEKHNRKLYALVSNMSIAIERREVLGRVACFVCNQQEASIFFSDNYDYLEPEEMRKVLLEKVQTTHIKSMVVTMGEKGAVYASDDGESGYVEAIATNVVDTTGAGDAFFAGVVACLTYGKSLKESCIIASRLASSVISSTKAVCPRFEASEFGLQKR